MVDLNEENFAEEVLESSMPVFVDFCADWCGPCRTLSAVLEEFGAERKGVKITQVNVDKVSSLASKYSVSAIPSVFLFRGGEEIDRFIGLKGKDYLQEMLEAE